MIDNPLFIVDEFDHYIKEINHLNKRLPLAFIEPAAVFGVAAAANLSIRPHVLNQSDLEASC